MADVTMPRLSDTMEEGMVGRWLKQPGDRIEVGDIIAEIETDKANMDLEAFESGTLLQILVPEGQTVPIGQPIALIGEGAVVAARPVAPAAGGRQASAAANGARGAGATAEAHREATRPSAPQPARTAEQSGGRANDERILASPIARLIAEEHGIDLRAVQGTGPGGRIIRQNVADLIEAGRPAPAAAATPPTPAAATAPPRPAAAAAPAAPSAVRAALPSPAPAGVVVPLSRGRRAVARAMTASKPGVPHLYVAAEIDMAAALRLRREINEDDGADVKISVNDLIVKAAARALRKVPALNSSYAAGADGQPGVIRHEQVNVSVAVALEDGLVAPMVRDTDTKDLSTIATEIRDLAGRAREGRLKQSEIDGGSFTVSNLGMFDVFAFVSVITPPQAASLAVGSVRRIPVVRDDGQVGVGEMLLVVLSADHRVTDGATAARFLQEFKRLLESPMRLLV